MKHVLRPSIITFSYETTFANLPDCYALAARVVCNECKRIQ